MFLLAHSQWLVSQTSQINQYRCPNFYIAVRMVVQLWTMIYPHDLSLQQPFKKIIFSTLYNYWTSLSLFMAKQTFLEDISKGSSLMNLNFMASRVCVQRTLMGHPEPFLTVFLSLRCSTTCHFFRPIIQNCVYLLFSVHVSSLLVVVPAWAAGGRGRGGGGCAERKETRQRYN